ncbi:hypothetical protein BJH90_12825 [Bacillus halotolerans]|uniref:hypothetical protein n=1 Tax=Bacillus subtilis group TaxID=653685 RepID=UPI000CD993B2|nr:hypothetical protein [Bacillus halotolerans]PON00333.1 hypothetical protein BJH90_12825 [Bacillus halotolerans]
MSREEKDPHLTHLKGLLEMCLSAKLLLNEIFAPLKMFLSENEINTQLSKRTGKIPNSIYRDKNNSVSFNVTMFLRYWSAMLEIFEENEKETDQLPNLADLVKKYKKLITAISQIEGEISLEGAVENHLSVISETVLFFEQNPFSGKKEKQTILNILKEQPDVRTHIMNKRIERMTKVD